MDAIGRYQLREEIGRGAAGVVHRAYDPSLRRDVAVKLLHSPNEALRRRFAREAEALSRLRHPNVVAVFDAGEQRGLPYLVLELIEGQSLEAQLQREGPLPVERAAAIARKLALALAQAHLQGILHRDVKPANVLIAPGGEPMLTDFGLARDVAPGEGGLTHEGSLLGTPGYWAPEQAHGDLARVGPASDVYALGATLHALLTGVPPHGGSLAEILASMERPIPPLRAARPEVSPALDALCLRCLAPRPEDRPSAAEVAEALAGAAGERRPGTPRALVAGAGVALLLAAGALTWLWVGRERPAVEPPGATASASPVVPTSPPVPDPELAGRLLEQARAEQDPARAAALFAQACAASPQAEVRATAEEEARRAVARARAGRPWLDRPLGARPYCLAMRLDGAFLACALDDQVWIEDLTAREGRFLPQPKVCAAAYLADGDLLTCDQRGNLVRRDPSSGEERAGRQVGRLREARLSQGGAYLALRRSSDSPELEVWDVGEGKELGRLQVGDPRDWAISARAARLLYVAGGVWTWRPGDAGPDHLDRSSQARCAVDPEGARAVSAGKDGVWTWDLGADRPGRAPLVGPRQGFDVASCAVAAQGALIALGTAEGSVEVWPAAGERLAVLAAHPGEVRLLALDGAGQLLATCDKAGVLRVWRLGALPGAPPPIEGFQADPIAATARALGR